MLRRSNLGLLEESRFPPEVPELLEWPSEAGMLHDPARPLVLPQMIGGSVRNAASLSRLGKRPIS